MRCKNASLQKKQIMTISNDFKQNYSLNIDIFAKVKYYIVKCL